VQEMLEIQKYGIFVFVFVIFFLAIRQMPLKKEFTVNQYLKLKLA